MKIKTLTGITFIIGMAIAVGTTAGISWAAEQLPPGVIAIADKQMNYAAAEAFCQQNGGKLPRINNSDSWNGTQQNSASLDGFAKHPKPDGTGIAYPVELQKGKFFWTGTKDAANPNFAWYIQHRSNNSSDMGEVNFDKWIIRGPRDVMCVR